MVRLRHKRLLQKRVKSEHGELPFSVSEYREIVHASLSSPCPYCGEALKAKEFSCDHETPLERGGSPDLWNLRIICLSCNKAKGRLNAVEFSYLMELLFSWEQRVRNELLGRLKAGASVLRLRFLG